MKSVALSYVEASQIDLKYRHRRILQNSMTDQLPNHSDIR